MPLIQPGIVRSLTVLSIVIATVGHSNLCLRQNAEPPRRRTDSLAVAAGTTLAMTTEAAAVGRLFRGQEKVYQSLPISTRATTATLVGNARLSTHSGRYSDEPTPESCGGSGTAEILQQPLASLRAQLAWIQTHCSRTSRNGVAPRMHRSSGE